MLANFRLLIFITQFMKNITLNIFFALAALSSLPLNADVFVLKNGDRITGEVAAKTDDKTSVQTPYALIDIPNSEIVSVSAVPTDKKQEEIAKEAVAEKPAEESAAQNAIAASDKPAENVAEEKSFIDEYKDFVHGIVPEGWEFKLTGAVEYRKTDSQTTSYTFGFEGFKKWGELDEFKFNAYYDYAYEKGTLDNGMSYRNKTTDKYGIGTNYKHFFEQASNWYFTNTLAYSVDMIKGIKDQVDEIVGLGRSFKFLDEKLVINVSVGPSIRYVNADGYDEHWVPMATFMEDLTYKFHKYSRFEQNFFAGISLTNVHKYNYMFSAGIVFEVTEVVNLAARYFYSYDAVNSGSAQKKEERLTLGFEIPLK